MSLTNRRRLPNVNSQKQRLLNPVLSSVKEYFLIEEKKPDLFFRLQNTQNEIPTMSPIENVKQKLIFPNFYKKISHFRYGISLIKIGKSHRNCKILCRDFIDWKFRCFFLETKEMQMIYRNKMQLFKRLQIISRKIEIYSKHFQVQLNFDRRLQDIKRKLTSSTYHDEEKISQANKHRVLF